MKDTLTVARLDLAVWRRSPWAVVVAIIPALGMFILVHVLSLAVTRQPVALVVNDHGENATVVADFIKADVDSYKLDITTMARARRLLATQQVAAIIEIPRGFDKAVARGRATLNYTLNNIDLDFSDDIRRSVDRSVAQFDAPQLGSSLEGDAGKAGLVVPNPYRVDIAETDLRATAVPFETYQVLPVVLLLIISVGVLGGALLGSRDHERNTIKFLRSTPLGNGAFVLGRLLGTFLAILMIVAPVVAFLVLTGVIHPPTGHWPAFLVLLVETAILAAGIGVLLGVVCKRSSTVALAAVIVASYLFFLGGGFTTIAFLPEWLRVVSHGIPTRYAIDGMRQALFYPDLRGMTTDLLALGLFSLASVGAGVTALRLQT